MVDRVCVTGGGHAVTGEYFCQDSMEGVYHCAGALIGLDAAKGRNTGGGVSLSG